MPIAISCWPSLVTHVDRLISQNTFKFYNDAMHETEYHFSNVRNLIINRDH